MFDRCSGVAIIVDNKVLLGKRSDGQGWGLAGGKQEENESLKECALRETKEEFCITPKILMEWGRIEAVAIVKGEVTHVNPMIYVCNEYEGTETPTDEMTELRWIENTQLKDYELFAPSKRFLERYFGCEVVNG